MIDPDGRAAGSGLRVSAATLNRVLISCLPEKPSLKTNPLLALERKATLTREGNTAGQVLVRVQPFGGAVRIRDLTAFQERVGPFHFDSPRSEEEQDLRILIEPGQWPLVRALCLEQLAVNDAPIIDGDPARELVEEFYDALHAALRPDQYTIHPSGLLVEDHPKPTTSGRSPGYPTVRVYSIFEMRIKDPGLARNMLENSQSISGADLASAARADARHGGKGYANAAMVLPLETVIQHYLSRPPQERDRPILAAGHELDPSITAVLDEVERPGLRRIQV